jgi:hypothetical protein
MREKIFLLADSNNKFDILNCFNKPNKNTFIRVFLLNDYYGRLFNRSSVSRVYSGLAGSVNLIFLREVLFFPDRVFGLPGRIRRSFSNFFLIPDTPFPINV